MKKIFLLLLLLYAANIYCQNKDSLIALIYKEKVDSSRIRRIYDVILNSGELGPEEVIPYHQKILDLTREKRDKVCEAIILSELGYTISLSGNASQGADMALKALKIAEKKGNQQALGIVYNNLGVCYGSDRELSKSYYKKALKASEAGSDYLGMCWAMLNLSARYWQQQQWDSAMYFTQRGYGLATSKNIAPPLPGFLRQLGKQQLRMGNKALALVFYRTALDLPYTQMDKRRLAHVYLSFAEFYKQEDKRDSALYYARLAFDAVQHTFYSDRLPFISMIGRLYYQNNSDSSLKYALLSMIAKDSVFSIQKMQQLQVLGIEESNRQRKIEEERKQNIQYAALAFGLVMFFILFLVLSRSIITNTKIIEFLGVVALLIVFEFLNLLLHPFLERVTNHSPVLMLLALVFIAAMLVPAHHRLQKWMTHTLVEKNKKIRLAAAKKTIAKLEGDQTN